MSYFDGYLIPVPTEKLDAYKVFSQQIAEVYLEYGAIRVVDCLLDSDVSNDEGFHATDAREELMENEEPLRDFPTATAIKDGEVVIMSWTEWPSKEARDSGLAKALADPRVQPQDDQEVLFEGRRLIAGGFIPLIDV